MRSLFLGRALLACAGGLLLSACALNALRTEYAGDVATQGAAVAAASGDFLHRVETARRGANIEMVVADPVCGTSPARIRSPINLQQSGPGWLCLMPSEPAGPQNPVFRLQRLSSELEPTLLLVGALSSYSEALADIVDSEPSDPLKPLLDALATARSAQGFLLAATGSAAGPVPPANDARLQAVQGFVAFLSELSDEANRVRELRKIIAANPQGAGPTIAALRDHLSTWELSRKGDEGFRLAVTGAVLRRTINAAPPVAPDIRRKSLTTFYEIQDADRAAAKIHPALSNALDELQQADEDLRRVLVEHPNLNAKERARIAELNRQRAVRALDLLTALITSFKGT